MTDIYERFTIQRVTRDGKQDVDDVVVRELPLTIILNNRELVTLLCSPDNLKYLTVGFLFSEGLLDRNDEIKKILVDDQRGVVRVETVEDKEVNDDFLFKRLITSGCGRGVSFYSAANAQTPVAVESKSEISAMQVFSLVREFQARSEIYRTTGGVHSAALCNPGSILVFSEDIGRHNAIDKIIGECILNHIPMDNCIVVTSGRISSEILLKVMRRNVPILISRSAPTNAGVKLANVWGMTIIGFVRGGRMNVYSNGWRVTTTGSDVEMG